MVQKKSDIKELQGKIKKFVNDRDWKQFHNHKDMAISLVMEATEVLEHFQWKNPKEIEKRAITHKSEIADEIADVGIYLLEFADNLDIDFKKVIEKKLKKNEQKYPISKARGKNTKYNEL